MIKIYSQSFRTYLKASTINMTQLLRTFKQYLSAFLELIFPRLCLVCNRHLLKNEIEICNPCCHKLPKTNFVKNPKDNLASQLFWGRINLENVIPIYYLKKEEALQELLYELKYRGNKEIGLELGRKAGQILKQEDLRSFDFLIPVPLHYKKFLKRGYNQSMVIAKGIHEILPIPINEGILYRKHNTKTQTHKNRYERWKNVEEIFDVRNNFSLAGKSILLIDDVLTTGATIESCAKALSTIPETKISILTIGLASH